MRETLHSLLAWCEGESWLRGNLLALGKSHWEYGVTNDMYDSFVDVMLASAEAQLGEAFGASRGRVKERALSWTARSRKRKGGGRRTSTAPERRFRPPAPAAARRSISSSRSESSSIVLARVAGVREGAIREFRRSFSSPRRTRDGPIIRVRTRHRRASARQKLV